MGCNQSAPTEKRSKAKRKRKNKNSTAEPDDNFSALTGASDNTRKRGKRRASPNRGRGGPLDTEGDNLDGIQSSAKKADVTHARPSEAANPMLPPGNADNDSPSSPSSPTKSAGNPATKNSTTHPSDEDSIIKAPNSVASSAPRGSSSRSEFKRHRVPRRLPDRSTIPHQKLKLVRSWVDSGDTFGFVDPVDVAGQRAKEQAALFEKQNLATGKQYELSANTSTSSLLAARLNTSMPQSTEGSLLTAERSHEKFRVRKASNVYEPQPKPSHPQPDGRVPDGSLTDLGTTSSSRGCQASLAASSDHDHSRSSQVVHAPYSPLSPRLQVDVKK